MKKTYFAACFISAATGLFSIPPDFKDSAAGWLDFSVDFTLTLPDFKPNFGIQFHGAGPDGWGMGLSLVVGESLLELTIDVLHYFEFDSAPDWSVPVFLKAGYINGGLGLALESGAIYFCFTIPTTTAGESYYVSFEALAGLHVLLYSFLSDGSTYQPPGFCFKPYPSLALNAGFDMAAR